MSSVPSGSLFQRDEVVAEHQVHRDRAEQVVVELKVAQVDELAAIAPGDVLRLGQISLRGARGRTGAVLPP